MGDLLHSPVQILAPSCNRCFCLDAEQAVASRHWILERAVVEKELVVPAYFGGAGAVEVWQEGAGFTLGRWAAYGTE